MADKKMSEMATDSSLDGTERLLAQGTDGSIIVTATLAAYVIDVLVAAAEKVPTTGDAILMERAGEEGTFDLNDLADYVQAYLWSDAATVTPLVSGDLLLLNRSGVFYDCNIDTVTTYVTTGIQATVLNTSALTAATLAATDKVPICVAATPTVPRTATLTALTTYLDAALIVLGTMQTAAFTAFPTKLAALSARTVPDAADKFYTINGSTAYYVTLATLAEYCVDATYDLPWQLIAASKYTALAFNSSTLAMSDTSDISIGDPVKFKWSTTYYYAVVTGVSGNTSITIAGAPFSTTESLTALYVGTPGQVKHISLFLGDLFGDTEYDIMSTAGRYERWEGSPAYLVAFAATAGEVDTGADQPKINVKIGGNAVSTDDTNKGLQIDGTAGTWTANSAVAISTTHYSIARGEAIEVACTEAGTEGDAADLSITLTFVYE